MTTSSDREMIKSLIGRLLEIYALEGDIDLFSYGSATFRRETSRRGLEPDDSYCIGTRKDIPDVAIEVVIASGGIDKLEIHRGLNVPEVWFWQGDRFTIYQLVDTRYVQVDRTQLLPDLDLN